MYIKLSLLTVCLLFDRNLTADWAGVKESVLGQPVNSDVAFSLKLHSAKATGVGFNEAGAAQEGHRS